MADSTISGLSAAATADRTMEVPVNKGGGENAKVTLEQIVDLVSDTISHALSVAQVPASVTSAELASVTSGVGGSGSVTSDELSAVSSQISLTNSALGSVDARITSVGQVVSLISDRLSNEISARAASIQTISDAVTSVDTRVNAVSQGLCVLSNVVSNEISARAASIQTLSNAVTSVDTRVNTVSQGLCVLSNVVSNEISARAASIQTLSDAVTSVDTRLNAVSQLVCVLSNQVSILESVVSVQLSQLISAVSNVSANSDVGSATGLQNVINLLSNKISQVVAGGGLTSAQTSAMITSVNGASYSCRIYDGATSVKGLQSVIDSLSNTFSNAFSAGSVVSSRVTSVYGQVALITATVVESVGAALANITGTTLAVSAGGYYEYRAHLNVAMSAANTYGIGITFPGMVDGAATGYMYGAASVGASAGESVTGGRFFAFDEDGSGSIILSVTKGVGSVTPAIVNAAFAVSTSGNIILQYRSSVSTANVKINPGSYARLFKLN
jgi:trimeric autotransporter adhesin